MTTTQPISNLTPEQNAEQARILQGGSGFEAYHFAYKVPGADIAALQARVLTAGDAMDCYLFARDVRGADIAAFQERVLTAGNAAEAYYFARIPNADVQALYARAQAQGFAGLIDQQRVDFDALVAETREHDKEITVLLRAFATGDGSDGPDGVAFTLNAEFLNKIRQAMDVSKVIPNLANVCLRETPQVWLPAGVEDDLLLQDPILSITPEGSIFFEDVPADGDWKIQSVQIDFDYLKELLQSSSPGDVVFGDPNNFNNSDIREWFDEFQADGEDGDLPGDGIKP